MSTTTTNYNLIKPSLSDSASINTINSNMDTIDSTIKNLSDQSIFQTAGGTANAITLTLPSSLVNGCPITFIASANNNGSATTINGKPLYKPNTTTAPNLVTGKAYTVWYNSTGNCFLSKLVLKVLPLLQMY